MGMEIGLNVSSQVALFVIKGRIGWEDARQLDKKISSTIEKGSRFIIFNLDEVVFLGSGGIGALVYHMKKVQKKGGDIFIVSNNDYIQYLFATIGFHIVFKDKIFETFEEFQEKVLSPKGLMLNPFDYESDQSESEEETDEAEEKNLTENLSEQNSKKEQASKVSPGIEKKEETKSWSPAPR